MTRALFWLVLVLVAWPAQARELDGTTLPDTVAVAGEKQPLALNGAGYRKKFMLKVYIGALYAGAPLRTTQAVLQHGGARVMRLHFLRELGADKLAGGWQEGFAANLEPAALAAMNTRLTAFTALMPAVHAGDVLRLELLASGQTRVVANDRPLGSVDGADFQQALLRVWLGDKPADSDMKQALLGGGR